ncbi:hypothetical protein Q5752_003699 [Cryptotrichosporon argae]
MTTWKSRLRSSKVTYSAIQRILDSMGKKKSAIKVDRGFATTSIPKKQKEEPKPEPEPEPATETVDAPAGTTQDDATCKAAEAAKDEWDDDAAIQVAELQALVDRLHDKGEKEISRIVKAIEYDKRFALSFPKLEINPRIRDAILALALEEETPAAGLAPATGADADKALLRYYVAQGVLLHLRFGAERVSECLASLGNGDAWEEALEWMWLHCSEDECLQRGEYARKEEPTLPDPDPPLIAAAPPEPELKAAPAAAPVSTAPAEPAVSASLFQSLDGTPDSDASSDEDDGDPDPNRVNEQWAALMLELDGKRTAAGAVAGAKGKGGKKKGGGGVVLETPEMVKLKAKMGKLEKEYMFSRKEADGIFKALKAKRDAAAIEARLRGVTLDTPKELSTAAEPVAATDATPQSDEEDEGGLFGALLDEPAAPAASTAVPADPADTGATVAMRSMPIPKQFAFTGNLPKALLRTHLTRTTSTKHAVLSYAQLSHSRAARAGLEIRWSAERRRVWRMDDVGCDTLEEAENYVSVLALHELSGTGDVGGVNWRAMPPAYKDLWVELEIARKDKDEGVKREAWRRIRELVERKTVEPAVSSTEGTAKTAPSTAPTSVEATRPPTPAFSERLQADYERRAASPAYVKMRAQRDTLPIAPFRQQILDALDGAQVLVFSGETGCGKSTQLPAYILEHELSRGRPCRIYVTEPRRISAISLAQRVSQELGDAPGAVGSSASLVGYSIRLEAKVSAATRLAFVTNGIALRMLEAGSAGDAKGRSGTAFDDVTHIIVDEVHERSIESDFLLIVLKSLLAVRHNVKVVLMSATVDADKISAFFGGCPTMTVPGRTFPVDVRYLEDAVECTGWRIDESSPYAVRKRHANAKAAAKGQLEWTEESALRADSDDDDDGAPSASASGTSTPAAAADPGKLSSAKYSAGTVSTVNLLDSRQIPYDLVVRLLERICFDDPQLVPYSAATLVFMPGLAEIRKLNDLFAAHERFGARDFVVYPLHSSVSSEGQSAVFERPPQGVRKIVISTNIAETGVTIPDITCVIDSGKHREMRYDEKRQISRLVETYIARSNAKQRRGRAGRVQPGLAFHLFTRARHDTALAESPVPEMLRLSLQDLALRIKILRVPLGRTIEDVLAKALDPPSPANIQRAVNALVEVKALTGAEDITPMGRLLSKLPMDVHLGKFLLVAAMSSCLDPALTIAATLNSKSPFVTPFGLEAQADAAKKGFAVGNSDFLTLANVFDCWRRASDNSNFVRTFCKRNFVSHQNLQQIEELRQQLLAYLVDSGFVGASATQRQEIAQARYHRGFRTRFVTVPPELNVNGQNVQVISATLAAGLYPKLLVIEGGGMRTIGNQQAVAVHPSSVNFRVPLAEFGTAHLVYFTLMQSKRLYAWEVGPVDDRALALLTGDVLDFKLSAGALHIDRKIRFAVSGKTALALKLARDRLAAATAARMRGRALADAQTRWFELAWACVATGEHDDGEGEGRIGVA